IVFFGQHDLGCNVGGPKVSCQTVAISILDLDAKQSISCVATNASAEWSATNGRNPFRVKSSRLNASCWRFSAASLPPSASSASVAQDNDYSKYRAGAKFPPAFVWIYDKSAKSVTICTGNGWP